ncbi:MAG TPA: N-acetylmuramic acid 6-phosphate etherase [Acidobacteriaceae bacterium]
MEKASGTEADNPQTLDLDCMSAGALVSAMHAADAEAVAAVEAQLGAIAIAVERIAERLRAGGRLLYQGAGTSGRLGVLDASECPPTFDCPPELVQGLIAGGDRALRFAVEGAEDDAAQGRRDLAERGFGRGDTLVGIAASGRTPYVLGGLGYAREQGAWTVGLSCVPGSAVERAADQAITPETGAEVLVGSTRLKAGTATKLVLNMLSTGAMVRMGYVYGNLMVQVQPTNSKLRDRAERLVARLAGVSGEESARLLEEAGSVRVAVVMHRLGVEKRAAEERLRLAGGRLREVVG